MVWRLYGALEAFNDGFQLFGVSLEVCDIVEQFQHLDFVGIIAADALENGLIGNAAEPLPDFRLRLNSSRTAR